MNKYDWYEAPFCFQSVRYERYLECMLEELDRVKKEEAEQDEASV